jgi:hypothetical protein
MSSSIQTIQSQVDSILFEQGSFSAIPWLLKVGHLDYADYLNWRKGEGGYLENHFKTTLPEIIASLKLAQHYAEKLNLDAVYQPYASIEQKALNICRSPANEIIFTTVYQPAEDRIQMDLFFDSAPILVVQDLIKAIVDQRDNDISILMAQLRLLASEAYTSFECLLAQQKQLRHCRATKSKTEFLLNTMTPLAFSVLGRFANDFLTPFWQQLSLELFGQRFDAESPQDHLSFTAFKAFQWREVIDAIESEADWNKQPVLLYRQAEACFRLNKEAEGLENWFRLYMLFPESAERLVNDTDNYLLMSDWRNFNELDPELDSVFFPAWMVLKKPALAKIKIKIDDENIGHDAFQLICGLTAYADNDINETTISFRTRLRQQNPSLFGHYMAACQ